MEKIRPRHVVLVRHGESEGDVRRATKRQLTSGDKHPRDEEQTAIGHEQSMQAGLWIARYILQTYNIDAFDAYLTSPLIRTKQSAESLDLSSQWIDEPRLAERDRGEIQGMTKQKHKETYPKSHQSMLDHPFHWKPPGGESLLQVSMRFAGLLDDVKKCYDTALIATHRDVMWAAHIPMDGMDVEQVAKIDTDRIGNGHIFHYTNLHPRTGMLDENLCWKRSIDPCSIVDNSEQDLRWVDLR